MEEENEEDSLADENTENSSDAEAGRDKYELLDKKIRKDYHEGRNELEKDHPLGENPDMDMDVSDEEKPRFRFHP